MEAWSKVEGDNIELAKIRVYNKDPRTGKQRIVLLVPSNPEAGPDVKDADTDEYEMDMVNEAVENQIVVAEREKAPGSRARTTILTGRIKHDCNLRPVFTEKYRQRMKQRTIKANTPARTIRMIDEVVDGRGAVNILNSGVGPSSTFLNLTVSNQKSTTWRVRSHLHFSLCRKRSRRLRRELSNALRVCRGTSFSIFCLPSIGKSLDGLQEICERARSSLKHTSRKFYRK